MADGRDSCFFDRVKFQMCLAEVAITSTSFDDLRKHTFLQLRHLGNLILSRIGRILSHGVIHMVMISTIQVVLNLLILLNLVNIGCTRRRPLIWIHVLERVLVEVYWTVVGRGLLLVILVRFGLLIDHQLILEAIKESLAYLLCCEKFVNSTGLL